MAIPEQLVENTRFLTENDAIARLGNTVVRYNGEPVKVRRIYINNDRQIAVSGFYLQKGGKEFRCPADSVLLDIRSPPIGYCQLSDMHSHAVVYFIRYPVRRSVQGLSQVNTRGYDVFEPTIQYELDDTPEIGEMIRGFEYSFNEGVEMIKKKIKNNYARAFPLTRKVCLLANKDATMFVVQVAFKNVMMLTESQNHIHVFPENDSYLLRKRLASVGISSV